MACHQRFQVDGVADVRVAVNPSGTVESASLAGEFEGTPTGDCIVRLVSAASFPGSKGRSRSKSRTPSRSSSSPLFSESPSPRGAASQEAESLAIDEKVKILAGAATLTGEQLSAFLEQHGVRLAEFDQWRLALDEEGRSSKAVTKRIRKLERELARKEKALAEAAALLVLKKRLERRGDEDDDTDEENEK